MKGGHAKQRLAIFPRQTDVIKGSSTAGEGSPVEWALVGRRRLGLALVAAIVSWALGELIPRRFFASCGFRIPPGAPSLKVGTFFLRTGHVARRRLCGAPGTR